MRYHWGLGVGHLHAHQQASTFSQAPQDNIQDVGPSQYEAREMLDDADDDDTPIQDMDSNVYDFGDAEFGLEDPDEGWENDESEDEESSGNEDTDSGDFTGM
jgi:hypothetical protein